MGVVLAAALAVGAALYLYTSSRIDRQSIGALDDRGTETEKASSEQRPLEFLVVGSDDRSELSEEEQAELTTGAQTGPPRTDVILVVQVRPGDQAATMVSFPRDLLVEDDGGLVKINSLVASGGRELLVRRVEELTGVQLDHYVEVSIPAFLTVVEAVGGVELCLDAPLRDPKSGADLPAGCQELGAQEALSFVRSREGGRGDFRRISRQQRFIGALAEQLTSARTLVDVPRLFRIANRVGGSLTTDRELDLRSLRGLAEQLRGLAAGDLDAATVPAYALEGTSDLRIYHPGARRLFSALRAAEDVGERGSRPERADADVVLWTGGDTDQATKVESVLYFMGFAPTVDGPGPADPLDTVVYATGDGDEAATWVANILGAELREPPLDVALPDRADAVVAVAGAPRGAP